jgi:molybdate transport system substrate-binding protein
MTLRAAITIAFMLLAHNLTANAAEVKVLAGGAIAGTLNELGSSFEKTTGHKLNLQYGLAPQVTRRIEAGEAFDVVILSPGPMAALAKQGKIIGSRVDIARSGIGVAVRTGAPKPDISSVDAFKRVMLSAKSVSYAPEATTGVHLAKVFERLGIATEMRAKTIPQQAADRIAQAVVDGQAEYAIALTSSLMLIRGIDVVGKLPSELQNYLVFTASISSTAAQPEAAKAFIRHLTMPEAIPVLKATGWEPVTR